MKKSNYFLLLLISFFIFSCGEELTIPKPPTYLRLDLPEHSYTKFTEKSGLYSFELAKIYKVKDVYDQDKKLTYNKDIDFGPLDGVMFLSYIQMEKPLSDYINYAINKVDEHKIKASAIEDNLIIRSEDKVYGTFFELQGDVASPFQFYLTDSVSRFVSGVVYLNKTPKYDSLKPSLEYLKQDLNHFVKTFQWK
ncbi:MAG: hypothetical protein ACK5B9_07465 [Flavobacteriia bacterium]|jgi:gliding motility-associated lipoprotein GldD